MRVAVINAALVAIQLVVCQSTFNGAEHNLSPAMEITPSRESNPDDSRLSRLERRFGEWILKRDTTTITDAVASTSTTESVASVTTSSSDATTTSESTTTSSNSTTHSSTSTTSSSFTTTTAANATTTTTTSSTSSSTATTSSSASTTASTTTTTATTTTTTSTTTPTPTESAEVKEWNHRGTIAAIVTFSILGSFFVGACIARCIHSRSRKRRIEAREQLDKESLLTLASENGKSASQLKLDRESIMFCDGRRSRPESLQSLSGQSYQQGSVGHSPMPSEDMGRSMSSGRTRPESVPSLSGQSYRQGSVAHSSMPLEDMGRSMSSGRQTPLDVRGEQHGTP